MPHRGIYYPYYPGDPGFGHHLPLKLATKDAFHQACAYQDLLPGHGHRILLSTGLNGGDAFGIPDTDPDAGAAVRHYYNLSTARTLARVATHLTPGYCLRLAVVAIPSGPTQYRQAPGNVFYKSGSGGTIRATVTFDNGTDTDTVSGDVWLGASDLAFNAQPEAAGQAFQQLIHKRSDPIIPSDFLETVETMRKWTLPGMRVTIELEALKSPRLVHAVVYEEPLLAAYEWADATKPPIHGYTTNFVAPPGYPLAYPVQRADEAEADPALGTHMMLEVAERQAQQLGPFLFSWSSYSDHSVALEDVIAYDYDAGNGNGDDEYPPWTTASATPVNILDTTITKWTAGGPGFAVGVGGFGRLYAQANREYALRGHHAVIRARVGAYMRSSTAGGTATLRFQSAPWDYVELQVSGNTWTFVEAPWHMTCGVTPEQGGQVQAFASDDDAGMELRGCWGAFDPRST